MLQEIPGSGASLSKALCSPPPDRGNGLPAPRNTLILSFSDWQTGIINPHAEITAKTTATIAILRMSFKRRERPGKGRPRGAETGHQQEQPARLCWPRGPSIARTGSIHLPAAGQMHSMKCPAWAGRSPQVSRPPSRLDVLLSITLARGHRFGPAPRGNGQSSAQDCASVGWEAGKCC